MRLEVNVKNPRENRCFQTVIACSFGSVDTLNKCTLLWKLAARLIVVSTSVNNEMWVKLSREEGRSLQTCEHHRASIRAFCRWARADGRLRDDPMLGVTGFNVREDVRHERRVLTDDELARLIESAETGPVVYHMDGPLRAMAYRVAAASGFRVNELRSLPPERFRLDGDHPSIILKPPDAKNRRGVEQPIPRALADRLSRFLAGKPLGQSVFPLHHETAKAIRVDLERAGIPYSTDQGVADFHSLRGYYISALVRSGASIKTVQTLARHSNPALTLARYARADVHDIIGVVESLPEPTPRGPTPEAAKMAATGTDGQQISERFAHYLPTAGDGTSRMLAEPDVFAPACVLMSQPTDETQVPGNDGVGRVLSASDGSRAERGGFEPPRPVSQSNGLANRRYRPLSHLSLIATRRPDRGAKFASREVTKSATASSTARQAVRRRTRDAS